MNEAYGVWRECSAGVLALAEQVGVAEAARRTGFSVATVYRWRKMNVGNS